MRLNIPFSLVKIFCLFVIVIMLTGYRNNRSNINDDKKQIASMLDSLNRGSSKG